MNDTSKKSGCKLMALALSVVMIGLAVGIIASDNALTPNAASAETASLLMPLSSAGDDLASPFKAAYQEASQSIVGIKLTTQLTTVRGRINQSSAYVGSGVVIGDEGHVITNYHVVTANTGTVASDISVIYDGKEYAAEYVAGDEASDIAVLKVPKLNAPGAKLGNSDAVEIGDWALVIGNPINEEFANTLTIGVISGKNRDMTTTDRRTGKTVGTEMLQTNAQVNSGNSGGGLFNVRGELIGITSQKLSSGGYYGMASIEGIGFAIPINTVSEKVNELIRFGEIREPVYPRLGISVQEVAGGAEEPTKDALPSSLWVIKVEAGQPADRAGIEANDLIVRADGQRVKTLTELQELIRSHEVGETIEIEVYRIPDLRLVQPDEEFPDGEYMTFTVDIEIIDEQKQ